MTTSLLIARSFIAGGAAALVAMALLRRPVPRPPPPLQLDVQVASPFESPQQSVPATVGDRIAARASGADQLWLYRDRVLMMRCPSPAPWPPGCAVGVRGLELGFLVDAAARYHVLAIGGAPGLIPAGDFEGDVRAVRHRGGGLELQSIRATAPAMLPR